MATKRKKTLAESASKPMMSTIAADGVALGTATGALMLGALRAEAAGRSDDHHARAMRSVEGHDENGTASNNEAVTPDISDNGEHLAATYQTVVEATSPRGAKPEATVIQPAVAAPSAAALTAATPEAPADHARLAAGTAAAHQPPSADEGNAQQPAVPAETASSALPGVAPAQVHALDPAILAGRIADQVTAAITQISSGLAQGASAETIGHTIADNISSSVRTILEAPHLTETIRAEAGSSLGSAKQGLDAATNLPSTIAEQVHDTLMSSPDHGGVDVSDLADLPVVLGSVLTDIAAAPGSPDPAGTMHELTGIASHAAAAIPSIVLGATGLDDASGGLLSSVFYSDGKASEANPADHAAIGPAQSPASDVDAAHALSQAAADAADSAFHPVEFTGVSFAEIMHDGSDATHSSLNAFSLL